MPWKASTEMSLKKEFLAHLLAGEESMSALCQAYGISRKTGYKYLRRFEELGPLGLEDLRKSRSGRKLLFSSKTWDVIQALREKHPTYGPRKLAVICKREWPESNWPSVSSIKQWLRKTGQSTRRKPQHRVPADHLPLLPMNAPNSVWCIDFKGWITTQDKKRLEPLTLIDGYSRYLLTCSPLPKITINEVKPVLERVFFEYGKPIAIRSDNGTPFGSGGYASLTKLSVWLLRHGIWPEKIPPGRPDQNGRLERLHRTLKEDAFRGDAFSYAEYEHKLREFQDSYNSFRPHEALNDKTPTQIYTPSGRPYNPDDVPTYCYPSSFRLAKVTSNGYINLPTETVYLSESLIGEVVGIGPEEEKGQPISFLGYPLGYLEQHRKRSRKS